MKKNAIIRIVIYSLAILILGSILWAFMADEIYLSNHTNAVESVQTVTSNTYPVEIRNIEIEWVCGNITIQRDKDLTCIEVSEFSAADSEHTMICKQSGQTLKIDYSEEDFEVIGIHVNDFESKDLVIRVPDEWIGTTIEIDTASAEVFMLDIEVAEFDFDGASGNCQITDCVIGEMDIDTASGNVTFSGTLDTLDCDAASADCRIEVSKLPRAIKMDALSGDLELILPPDAGFTCNLEAMSSSFDTDFACTETENTYTCGDGSCSIKISAMSGNVSILKGIE